jgi:predicted kinase
MRLVFIYGPPGVGKLTVARELAALTGFRLFHNHLTVDLVGAVFRRGTPSFGRLIHRFRRDVFAEAAQEGVDLIFTYVYAHPAEEPDVRGMIEPVLAAGGQVCFAQLACDSDVLLARVAAESRRAFRKLTDPEKVRSLLQEHDLLTPMPFAESLRLNVTDLPPAEAAARIAAHYGLSQ